MSRYFRRRKFCRFTAEGVTEIDYKDLNTLKNYITEIIYFLRGIANPTTTLLAEVSLYLNARYISFTDYCFHDARFS